MKICIVTEGSYPYITGGVSSWVQSLITSLPEFEFIIYAIGPTKMEKGSYSYKLPPNVSYVHEVFLDSVNKGEILWGKRYRFNQMEREAIKGIITGEGFCWAHLFELLKRKEFGSTVEFLMSKDFFDIVSVACEEKYPHVSFNEYFWSIRSMLLPLFELIIKGIPEANLYHSVSTGYGGVMASYGKYLCKVPFLLTEHGIYTREREEEIIKSDWVRGYFKDTWIRFFYNLSKCAYDSVDRVISISKRNKDIQIDIGCSKNLIEVIPNGVDADNYKDLVQKDPDDKIINVGGIVRVVPIKDIKTMIQAFAVANQEVDNLRLFIMGPMEEDYEYAKECKAIIEELELENVYFTGRVNIKEYIGKMDILLLSSISEGQPLSVLESMAAAKPQILTDVGCCRELMYGDNDSYGTAGVIVPIMDYEEMGREIVKLSQNEVLRKRYGQSGYDRVSNLYTKEKFIDSYRNIYNSFLQPNYGNTAEGV